MQKNKKKHTDGSKYEWKIPQHFKRLKQENQQKKSDHFD